MPPIAFAIDARSGDVRELVRLPAPVGLDPETIVVEQTTYASKDGTDVSMFLVHRHDVRPNGSVPTVLNGYGGFNVSRTPQYIAGAAAWVEAGGLFALPNLRGGGEYGERWHRAGMLESKQNVFDDFHAAAESLIASGWTRPEQHRRGRWLERWAADRRGDHAAAGPLRRRVLRRAAARHASLSEFPDREILDR